MSMLLECNYDATPVWLSCCLSNAAWIIYMVQNGLGYLVWLHGSKLPKLAKLFAGARFPAPAANGTLLSGETRVCLFWCRCLCFGFVSVKFVKPVTFHDQ